MNLLAKNENKPPSNLSSWRPQSARVLPTLLNTHLNTLLLYLVVFGSIIHDTDLTSKLIGLSRMVYMLLSLTICFSMDLLKWHKFLCTNSRLCLEGQQDVESTPNNCISRTEWASADSESQSKVCAMPVLESEVPCVMYRCLGRYAFQWVREKQHFMFWAHYYQQFLLPSLIYCMKSCLLYVHSFFLEMQ